MPRLIIAQIARQRRHYGLGRWLTEREVRIARDRAALHFDGPGASLEHPEQSRRLGPASPEELRRLAHATWKAARATSRYRGVSWDRRRGAWHATIKVQYVNRGIGSFPTERAAAFAYDQAALFYFARHAALNFPTLTSTPRSVEDLRRELALAQKAKHKNRYRGVVKRIDKRRVFRYAAYLGLGREGMGSFLGSWKTEREAALAHDRAALFYRRARAWLNFPKLRKKLVPSSIEELRNESQRVFKAQTSSRFRGVTLDRRVERWAARIEFEGRKYHLGYFDDEEDAARAYDRAARRHHGRKAKLNFDPATGEELLWRARGSRSSKVKPRGSKRRKKRWRS